VIQRQRPSDEGKVIWYFHVGMKLKVFWPPGSNPGSAAELPSSGPFLCQLVRCFDAILHVRERLLRRETKVCAKDPWKVSSWVARGHVSGNSAMSLQPPAPEISMPEV
jgi:hypothetical protein